eukprot:1488034-Prymnesium_polylepis.1
MDGDTQVWLMWRAKAPRRSPPRSPAAAPCCHPAPAPLSPCQNFEAIVAGMWDVPDNDSLPSP